MIRFRSELYISDSIRRPESIKRKLRSRRGQLDVYIIALKAGQDQLEYFHNGLLKQDTLFNRDLYIVGLARSDYECVDLISRIAEDTYTATGTYDMKSYLASGDH